jgi:DNA (cytosine-5)-methyltransferase 1
MLRVIREARPAWIVGENVAGIVNMALDQVHADLEAEGYEVESIIIPACAVDAPHRRDRVWIVANSTSLRNGGGSCVSKKQRERMVQGKQKRAEIRMQVEGCGSFADETVANSNSGGCSPIVNTRSCTEENSGRQNYAVKNYSNEQRVWEPEPNVGRVAHGIPNRVAKLRGLGNAIVPQVAAEIIRCIVEVSK